MNKGQRIRDYILLERIGEGGMGEIWKARHQLLESRLVAVKAILPERRNDPDFRARFLQEAATQDRLHHEHIVGVREFFEEQGIYYLVMPFIEGESLEDRLERQRGPLPLDEALRISQQVLDALNYAHQKGVIHRDVKPSNILLDRDGRAHLMDFGIALIMGQRRKTRTGLRLRSVYYSSPEQIRAEKDINHQTDVYSFGCVLYEMLTGRLPFGEGDEAESDYAIEDGHVRLAPTPPSRFNRRIPADLEQVVLRALAKEPGERWGGCGDFARSLNAESDEREDRREEDGGRGRKPPEPPRRAPTIVETPVPHSRRVDTPWPSISLVAILVLGAIGYPLWKQARETVVETVNGVQFEMVPVSAGSFQMGSENGQGDEQPVHEVRLSGFYMSKHEVTQKLWRAVAQLPQVYMSLDSDPASFSGDDNPVNTVSWWEAREFCTRLSRATGQTYRLPTEAEWEYASRAVPMGDYKGDLSAMAWYSSNSGNKTHPVGGKQPNAFGLYDIYGNVWEWCQDQWHDSYNGAPEDGTAWADISSSGSTRVDRGGGWYDYAVYCRSANRNHGAPGHRNDNLGFRLVRT